MAAARSVGGGLMVHRLDFVMIKSDLPSCYAKMKLNTADACFMNDNIEAQLIGTCLCQHH